MAIKFNSLGVRLAIALVLMVLLPTIITGWIAYNAMFETIRSERIKDVGQVANSKHDQLVMVLTRANSRAEHFLSDLSAQCSGNAAKQAHLCATGLIRAYLAAEGAIGATLRRKSGDNLAIGTSATRNEEPVRFQTGQLAKFSGTGPKNNHSYFVSVAEKSTGSRLEITYPSSVLEPVFNPPPADLGLSGETFLADGEGYFVTKPRYASTQGHKHPISAHPMQSCLSGQSREVLDLDYRDAAIIHGFQFIPEFGTACIMAHITQDEAFAPLKSLEQKIR